MTDVREHLPDDKDSRLLRIAQREALLSKEPHDYLPKTPMEADKFWPHDWVLEAMRCAYSCGQLDGAAAAKERMREAIGAAKW